MKVLIVVDMQNDFIDGSLAVAEAEQIIEPVNSIADEIREHDGTVVFTRDWHPEKTPHFEKWPVHCVANTRGADFHKDLNIQPERINTKEVVGDASILIVTGNAAISPRFSLFAPK